MSKIAQFQERLGQTKKWLAEAGFNAEQNIAFDFPEVIAKVKAWYPANPARADHLLAKAARQLRGEAVDKPGAPYRRILLRTNDTVELVKIAGGEAVGTQSYKITVSGPDHVSLSALGEGDDLVLVVKSEDKDNGNA